MNALWVSMFSMRSYETGQYSILKDGNFQLTIARVLASNFDENLVTVPEDSSDFDEAVQSLRRFTSITLLRAKYGMNAVETREKFWQLNENFFEVVNDWFDVLISDQVNSYPGRKPIAYNFNISKLPELDRPYVDKFFEAELASIEKSLFATVINPRQREYILEVRPDLADEVFVNTKVAHQLRLPSIRTIDTTPLDKNIIFWPFRISDKAYQWEQFSKAFEDQGLHRMFRVILTDPNDSLKSLPSWATKIKPTKHEYYEMLALRPIVIMLDDIDTVLHPGTVEFIYYRCPLITYDSKLMPNSNLIDDLDGLTYRLINLKYNTIDMKPFVYDLNEIESMYNKDFVNERIKN